MSMLDAAVNWLFPDCYYNRIWKGNAGPEVDKIHLQEIATEENALLAQRLAKDTVNLPTEIS